MIAINRLQPWLYLWPSTRELVVALIKKIKLFSLKMQDISFIIYLYTIFKYEGITHIFAMFRLKHIQERTFLKTGHNSLKYKILITLDGRVEQIVQYMYILLQDDTLCHIVYRPVIEHNMDINFDFRTFILATVVILFRSALPFVDAHSFNWQMYTLIFTQS